MQPQVRAVPPGQFVRPFRDFHAASENAAKRRIKKTALPHLGQVQHLAEGVEQMTVRNPALQPVGCPGLDDLTRLSYAIAAGVWYIKITGLQLLGDGLPTQAW